MPTRAAATNEQLDPGASGGLFGRHREVAVLRGLIDGVHESGAALMVRGEPGIGKSALLAEARTLAATAGMRVLTTTGAHAEVDVPFAGLHQLLRPLRGELGALAPAQRDVVLAAFGAEVVPPQLYSIAVAVLELLATTAEHAPVLVIAEDAHWLDRCTTDVLAFVARRLESDPIVLVVASTERLETSLDEAGLRELELAPLDEEPARALLDAHAPHLTPGLRARLLLEAAGNPLALVELPRSAAGADEGTFLPTWLPLTTRLEQAFAARVSELPPVTRGALLTAAVNDDDDLSETLAAASLLVGRRISDDDLAPAVKARLVELDDSTLRFRHSLVRSAVRQGASITQRHAAHAALADMLTAQPARRIWHRAASIMGTDDSLAAELETVALQAHQRGSFAEAVTALERASSLCSDPAQRATRLLRAAELAFELGRRDVVSRLLDKSDTWALGPQERTRLMFIDESLEDSVPGDPAAATAIAELAERAGERGETDLALRLLAAVGTRCWWGDYDDEIRQHLVRAALAIAVPPDDPYLLAILAWAAPITQAERVAEQLAGMKPSAVGNPEHAHLCGMAATAIGHLSLGVPFFDIAVDGLRSQGRLALLAQALVMRAWSRARSGDWSRAVLDAEEGALLARQTRQPSLVARAIAAEAAVAGLRGNDDLAATLSDMGDLAAGSARAHAALFDVQVARGLAALGAGCHVDAYQVLLRVFDPSDAAYHSTKMCWLIADLAQASLYVDKGEAARSLMPAIEEVGARTAAPDVHCALRHARALLADDEDCDGLYQAAIGKELSSSFDQARIALAYGTWLRRQRRVAESRQHLRAARDAFEALGAVTWADRAQQELRATGETARRRTMDLRDELTPQELQIAHMAADGLSNREIGQRLYLSHRTVGSHLYRLFPKLGISKRIELRAALIERAAEAT